MTCLSVNLLFSSLSAQRIYRSVHGNVNCNKEHEQIRRTRMTLCVCVCVLQAYQDYVQKNNQRKIQLPNKNIGNDQFFFIAFAQVTLTLTGRRRHCLLLGYSGVGSNLQVGGTIAGRNFFDVPPHFSIVPPHEGAQRLFVTD